MYHRESLQGALYAAIKQREIDEKKMGYSFDSAYLATLRLMKKDVDEGKQIQLRD